MYSKEDYHSEKTKKFYKFLDELPYWEDQEAALVFYKKFEEMDRRDKMEKSDELNK